ncbi:MAG: hypothetical protein ACOCSL_04090, partial [Thermoplasmatota archaeon]
ALRRILEQYSQNVRFVFSCNNSSKIIDPIRSRCVQLYYRPLSKNNVKSWLKKIIENEGLEVEDDAVKVLINYGKGNLRKITNLLQLSAASSNTIKEEEIIEYNKLTGSSDVNRLLKDAFRKDFLRVREELYKLMIDEGLSGRELLVKLHEELFKIPMDDKNRMRIVQKMADVDYDLLEGSNDDIHLKNLLAHIKIM